jgi:hypothetical protein
LHRYVGRSKGDGLNYTTPGQFKGAQFKGAQFKGGQFKGDILIYFLSDVTLSASLVESGAFLFGVFGVGEVIINADA